jgi:D-sedoheptulose 7-phosphate isomerase
MRPPQQEMTMTSRLSKYLTQTIELLEQTRDAGLDERTEAAIIGMSEALIADRAVLVCGNGGSAADAMHIAGELVARFLIERPALKVIDLCSNSAVLTAWSNDYDYATVFARQVEAYGEAGGVLLAISTSGNSQNVVAACEKAREKGMTVIGLTGEGGGAMASLCHILLDVPSQETPRIQEMHVNLYHFICQMVEERCAAAL